MSEAQKALENMLLNSSQNMFGIYQLKRGDALHYHRFEPHERLCSNGLKVERDNYILTYIGILSDTETLAKLFSRFNTERPDDFIGHSLSVSDIVVLQRGGSITAHYVDDGFNFTDIPDFIQKSDAEIKKCPVCQSEHYDNSDICSRCLMLSAILGKPVSAERLVEAFWTQCTYCYSDIIAGADFEGDELSIQCDNCEKIHIISLSPDSIQILIAKGIASEQEEE